MDDIKDPGESGELAGVGAAVIYNRQLLAADVADKTGLARSKALAVVDAVFEAASLALRDGKEVRIPGFGTFVTSERKAAVGADEAAEGTPDMKLVRFRTVKVLRELLSGASV